MKKQTVKNPTGTINATAAGIKKEIILEQFESITLWSKNSIKLTKKDGKSFWIYSLKNALSIFKQLGNSKIVIKNEDVLKDIEKNTSKFSEGLISSLKRVNMTPENLYMSLSYYLNLTSEDFNGLLLGIIPERFKDTTGQHILAYTLYIILGKPENYIGKDLYWRKLIKKNV